MLKVVDLNVYYGAIHALKSVSLEVNQGEIVTLIGANGAGKSTLIRTISGLVKSASGEMWYAQSRLDSLAPHQIVKLGVSQSPEGRRVFRTMSVHDNLLMGAYTRKIDRATLHADMDEMFTLFPRLKEREKQQAGTLSGGEQQMLAIARALMSKPRLLMLDEPSLGLAPFLVQTIFSVIQNINRAGVTILLVEQNAHQALRIAHRAYVLETGCITLTDEASKLMENDAVRQAYLGG